MCLHLEPACCSGRLGAPTGPVVCTPLYCAPGHPGARDRGVGTAPGAGLSQRSARCSPIPKGVARPRGRVRDRAFTTREGPGAPPRSGGSGTAGRSLREGALRARDSCARTSLVEPRVRSAAPPLGFRGFGFRSPGFCVSGPPLWGLHSLGAVGSRASGDPSPQKGRGTTTVHSTAAWPAFRGAGGGPAGKHSRAAGAAPYCVGCDHTPGGLRPQPRSTHPGAWLAFAPGSLAGIRIRARGRQSRPGVRLASAPGRGFGVSGFGFCVSGPPLRGLHSHGAVGSRVRGDPSPQKGRGTTTVHYTAAWPAHRVSGFGFRVSGSPLRGSALPFFLFSLARSFFIAARDAFLARRPLMA